MKRAHRPPSPAQQEHWCQANIERDLLFENLDLVLSHEQALLDRDEYFFCRPSFAICGVYCNSQINLGTLLIAWRAGNFIDTCSVCGGKSYVYSFGGLLSRTGWRGFCSSCGNTAFVWDGAKTFLRWDVVTAANRQFKDQAAEVVTIEQFLQELKTDSIRPLTPKDKTLIADVLLVHHGDRVEQEKIQIRAEA